MNQVMMKSRWEPPKGRIPHHTDTRAASGCGVGSGQPQSRMNNPERENNNFSKGGGKIRHRHRHRSNDTHKQRNQHRQRPPASRRPKNIISPDESTALANNSATNDGDIPKLNPDDKAHARRIQQRRRQVMFGKNTAGYEEYTKKVPRHKRRHRCLDCPMTPDYMLDIPTKRWQGLMNAWRRALHKYDPVDLHLRQPAQDTITLAPRPCITDDDKANEEIARAKAAGLQVAFGGMNVGKEAGMFSFGVANDDNGVVAGASSGGAAVGNKMEETMPVFEEEAAYRQQHTMDGGCIDEAEEEQVDHGGFLEECCDSDSDDDLL